MSCFTRISAPVVTILIFLLGCRSGPPDTAPAGANPIPRILIFHHALGVSPGITAFAEHLRDAGYAVKVPDLFDGRTFSAIEEGVAYAETVGFDTIIERGVAAVDDNEPMVVIGFSLGVMPAQKLAQTRPPVVAAILCHSAVPLETFGEAWPQGVKLQLHLVEHDPWAEEDLDVARALAAAANGTLFLYQGTGHLVSDPSHTDYDETIAQEIMKRTLRLLDSLH